MPSFLESMVVCDGKLLIKSYIGMHGVKIANFKMVRTDYDFRSRLLLHWQAFRVSPHFRRGLDKAIVNI
jgi:hypothetical protein